ncbi:hypothetical protein REMIM1_PF00551 (plasmid) [Rhizobium etli bv. mimosae str. Mim1]|nr:hypothetical protein REMIM1_PF00551 [Rhizobium etli bv. mimosae str. Mim1]
MVRAWHGLRFSQFSGFTAAPLPEFIQRQQKIPSWREAGSHLCFYMSFNPVDTSLPCVKLDVGKAAADYASSLAISSK